jgi:hypothetical protein
VGRRVLPVLFVAAAAAADATGAHALARDALVAALPFAAVSALVALGEYVDLRAGTAGLQLLCSGAIVVMLVLSCSARNAAGQGVPMLGKSTLAAVICLFALKGLLAGVPYLRRVTGGFWPAKP